MTPDLALRDVTVALLYRRVSSDDQAREGLSLKAQTLATRRYAVARSWTIGGEYEDVLAGTRDDRPRYRALLSEARRLRANGTTVVVVVTWLDRFGRSVFERARSADELRKLRVSVHSVMEGGQVPELVGNLLAAVAEEEVRRHGTRIVEARTYVAAAGWHYPTRAAWGYARRPATPAERALGAPRSVLAIHPKQAPYVREAWRRADAGDSFASIARWIQCLPSDVRGGRFMSYPCVRRMLSAAVYVARHAQGVPDVLARPVMRWPALVEDDAWSRVQARFRDRPARVLPSRRPHLLIGLLRCPACMSLMCGQHQTRQASQYVCRGRLAGAGAPDLNCHQSATMPIVDTLVLTNVRRFIEAIPVGLSAGAAAFRIAWDAARRTDKNGNGSRAKELAERGELARRRWANAAKSYVDGRTSRAHYERIRETALADLEAAEVEGQRLAVRTRTEELPNAEQLAQRVSAWKAAINDQDVEDQRRTLAELIESVTPIRVRRGHYDADITWTPLARALQQLAPVRDHLSAPPEPCSDPRCAPQGSHTVAAPHCSRHHLYDEPHTYRGPGGRWRRCLTCLRERDARRVRKR